MQFGISKDNVVIGLFTKKIIEKGKILTINKSMWIDLQHGFLEASPDCLIKEEDAIV